MFSTRALERALYRNREIDCLDYDKYPEVSDESFFQMECCFLTDEERVHIFPFVSCNLCGKAYVEIYVWDCELYPQAYYKRFVITDGLRLREADENEYLHYIREAKRQDSAIVSDYYMENLYEAVNKYFPSWHYKNYSSFNLSRALSHLYFASHRSGAREILYKSELYNIAYSLDSIPEYNIIGSSPTSIIDFGMPLKLLRILNHPYLIGNLFNDDTVQICKKVYEMYSNYIGKEGVSPAQWHYLEMLCNNDGSFAGRAFLRSLYNRLETVWGDDIVCEYGHFLELRDKMPEIKIQLPPIIDLKRVIKSLTIAYEFKTSKFFENRLISERAKDLYYEYEYGDYVITMPKNGIDFCMEAINQGNCLMNYINQHSVAETTILFLRERRNPNHSFVTMEVLNHTIVQVYAKFNALPDVDVYRFLEKYSKTKWLEYNPHYLIFGNDYEVVDECYISEELNKYLMDYEERNYWGKDSLCEEIEYYQMTLQDYFPDFMKNMSRGVHSLYN